MIAAIVIPLYFLIGLPFGWHVAKLFAKDVGIPSRRDDKFDIASLGVIFLFGLILWPAGFFAWVLLGLGQFLVGRMK